MNKKLLVSGILLGLMQFATVGNIAIAGYHEHYSRGQEFYFNAQYSSAIDEYKQALSQRVGDNSARIGLINSYLARGTYLANYEANYKDAANDFRSALFYLKYYVEDDVAMNSLSSISSATNSLRFCEKQYGADLSPAGHFSTAQELDGLGHYAAAMYEYEQVINNYSYRAKSLARIASMMAIMRHYQKADEYYKLVIETNPQDIMARLRYANVLDKIGNTKSASEQYNYILANCDNNPELLCDLERIYNKKLMECPNDANLLADLGAIKQRQGKYTEAYNYYKQSQSQPNRSEETALNTQINMATLLQVQGKYDQAIAAYKNILIMQPDNYDVNLYLAQCYEAKSDTRKLALQQYKKLEAMRPNTEEFRDKINELTRTSMSAEELYFYIKSVVKPDKFYVDELYNFALKKHEGKDYETAIKYYSLIKSVDAGREDVYENLAVCYAQLKNYAKAKEVIAQGQAKFPAKTSYAKLLKDIDADRDAQIISRAYNAYSKEDYNTAINLYSSVTNKNVDVMLGLAGAYQGLKQTDKALEYYKKALQLSPSNSDIAYSIGALYVNSQNYLEAKKYFQQALSINPNNTHALEALSDMKEVLSQTSVQDAVALIEHQQVEDALKLLNKALVENPNNADAYYYRATIYDGQGKYEAAIEDYKKSLNLNPNQPVTNYLIAIDYENLKDIKTALVYYRKFLTTYKTDDEYSQYVKARIPEIEEELKNGK